MLQRDTYILMLTLETTAGSCKILLPSQNKEGVFVNMLYDYISLSFKPPRSEERRVGKECRN